MRESAPEAPSAAPTREARQAQPDRAPGRGGLVILWLVVIAVAAALAFEWYDARTRIAGIRDDTAARLRASDDDARASLSAVKGLGDAVRELQAKVGAIEAKEAESRSREVALEAMFQELSRGRDDWLLAEAEQTLQIAAQQLQLAGNVPAALSALQAIEARLARSDRPQIASLREVVARDIERLKGAPSTDVTGVTRRVDRLIEAIDALPLRAEERQTPSGVAPASASARWWERWLAAAWGEVKSLVRVQRIDASDSRLLAPEHAYFLRENLKLRLLHARIAALQRNEAMFRGDVGEVSDLLGRYFDTRDASVIEATATLAQLESASLKVEVPGLAESLNAVRKLREPRESR